MEGGFLINISIYKGCCVTVSCRWACEPQQLLRSANCPMRKLMK